MELIVTENQYNLYFNLLNESILNPFKKLANTLSKTSLNKVTKKELQSLLNQGDIDISVLPTGSRLYNPQHIMYHLMRGELTNKDTGKVLRILFDNETDKEILNSLADYFIKTDKNFGKYKGKSKKEIIKSLSDKGYTKNQTDLLANKIYSYNYRPGVYQGVKRGMFHSPYKSLVKFVSPFHKLDNGEWRRLLNWLAFGTTVTKKELVEIYKKIGLKGIAISLGSEWLGRYLKLLVTLTVIKGIFNMANDNKLPGEKYPNMSQWEIAQQRAEKAFILPDAKWVIPAIVSWPIITNILGSLNRGTGLDGVYSNFKNWINKTENKISEMKKESEDTFRKSPSKTSTGIDDFKKFIKQSWGSDYNENNVTFYKKGNYYIVNDKSVNLSYLYIKNNNTFEYVPQ
jgi:hypothetical protein